MVISGFSGHYRKVGSREVYSTDDISFYEVSRRR